MVKIEVPVKDQALELLGFAKSNLRDKFAVVGLTEVLDESILLIAPELNWSSKDVAFPKRPNVTKSRLKRRALDDAKRELIIEYNGLNMELYTFAKELFRQRLEIERERGLSRV